ncbi:MAG: sugar ABC transporter permease, partial [Angelakisella sp.]
VKSLTDGGPGGVTESVSLLIYSNAFVENKFSYAIAEAIVVGVIIAAVSAVQISISNKKKV